MSQKFPNCFLAEEDPAPFATLNSSAKTAFVIACDHGGRALPGCVDKVGMTQDMLDRHIAWDIGARHIAERLSQRLDAIAICGTYSRLIVDLNRYPWDPAAIPDVSDATKIPCNAQVSHSERQARMQAIHRPYHDAISNALAAIAARGQSPVLVSVHTMTDRLADKILRREQIAVLYSDRDAALARAMLSWLREKTGAVVGDNTPYSLDEDVDFTVPEHAFRRRAASFMFEVRQDLVASIAQAQVYGDLIADGLLYCLSRSTLSKETSNA